MESFLTAELAVLAGDLSTARSDHLRLRDLRTDLRRRRDFADRVLFIYVAVQASGNPAKRLGLKRHVVLLESDRLVYVRPEARRIHLALADHDAMVPYSAFGEEGASITV